MNVEHQELSVVLGCSKAPQAIERSLSVMVAGIIEIRE